MIHHQMRTEVYVRDDIENILKAIDRANRDLTSLQQSREADLYRSGFLAALQAIATAFGIHLDSELTHPDHNANLPFCIIDQTSVVKRTLTAPNQ